MAASSAVPMELLSPADPRPRTDVGEPFQRFNGGWLALDFVNTVAAWHSADDVGQDHGARTSIRGERLSSYARLVEWSQLQRLIGDGTAQALLEAASDDPGEAHAVLDRARSLRLALFHLFRRGAHGKSPSERELLALNREITRLRRGEALAPSDRGISWVWRSDRAELEALLWFPLRSCLELLTSPDLVHRLRQCAGPDCGWLFLESTRGRPRRWCDIRDCGNVAKVRAYRDRRETAAPPQQRKSRRS